MWSLVLTVFTTLLAAAIFQNENSIDIQLKKITINPSNFYLLSFNIAQASQSLNLVEAASSKGFLLKYSSNWQRYTTQNSNPDTDVLLARNFPSPKGEIIIKITTIATSFMGLPRNAPKTIKKIDVSAGFFANVLTQSGYKVYQMTEVMINEKKGFKIVTETPKKLGSTIVLLEGKGETMVVSTSIYPIDTSIISRELLEQVMAEIGLVQNSITTIR